MKIALVYDRVNKFGGAERLLLALHKVWPEAPLFTSIYDNKFAPWADVFQIHTSFLQSWPIPKTKHEWYPFLMPFAFEAFNFDDFDVVISVTSAEAKGIITKPQTLHISYQLTPTRYLWSGYKDYKMHNISVLPLQSIMRLWDAMAACRVDKYLAISQNVARRIAKYYHQDSEVVYPPVGTSFFQPTAKKNGDYFLTVGRLVSYKRFDLVVAAFNRIGLPLKIIGTGSSENHLRSMAADNIEFLPNLTDSELLRYYQGCRAFVYAGEEDFGLVSLEAQACGRPVIAYGYGGLSETVLNEVTGILFHEQTVEALEKAVNSFQTRKFSSEACRKRALEFNESQFAQNIRGVVERYWVDFKKGD